MIDIRSFTAEELLKTNRVGDAVLAFLASGVEDRASLARQVVERVQSLSPVERKDALVSLLALSSLRKSERIVMEVLASMSLVIDWRENEFLREIHDSGLQEGMREGMQEGMRATLRVQLSERFGPLPTWAVDWLSSASESDLKKAANNVLTGTKLEDVVRKK